MYGEKKVVLDYMGRFRIFLAEQMGIVPKDVFEFVWVVDFEMFEVENGKVKYYGLKTKMKDIPSSSI